MRAGIFYTPPQAARAGDSYRVAGHQGGLPRAALRGGISTPAVARKALVMPAAAQQSQLFSFPLPKSLSGRKDVRRLGMLRSTCCAAAASRNLHGTQRYLLKTT